MQQSKVLCLLLLFISGYYAQDPTMPPDWNGDPNICTPDSMTTTAPGPDLPIFGNKAEFALEQVVIRHVNNATLPSQLTMFQYLYDYQANSLVLVKNANGFIDVEYYYYAALKVANYYRREFCVVTNLTQDDDMDAKSAVQLADGTWHIRPLNEFLLFSRNDPRKPLIRPRYIGQAEVRGISVDQWESCVVDKAIYRTVKTVWSIARKGVMLPTGLINDGDRAYPIQAIINASRFLENGTLRVEDDEVFNVHGFRQGIIESTDQLAPPKGVFCKSPNQTLASLRQFRMEWPDRFSIRVEASTSIAARWQRFHLRYDHSRGAGRRRFRYDYLPTGAEDYESVIHDYGDNLTYIIDRRQGSCKIHRGIDLLDVNPLRDPIGFFIRNEFRFIASRNAEIWEFNGYRACRGDAIRCTVVTSQEENYPQIIDPDTGKPSGETWAATNSEYGWAIRSPAAQMNSTRPYFDYPIHLFLKMYRFRDPNNPSPFNIITEDIEYEFYEMSHERGPNDFDTSICYRSNNLSYLHIGFRLQLSVGNVVDGNHLNRRVLDFIIHYNLIEIMNITYARVTDLEVDHERNSKGVNILFTLLGPTPAPTPEFPNAVATNEHTVEVAKDKLTAAINGGTFEFKMNLTDGSNTEVQFKAVANSLRSSKQFMSSHLRGEQIINEKYTSGSQAGAVIGGILVGLVVGIVLAAVVRILRKEPMPAIPKLPTSVSNPLPNISFYNKKPASDTATTTTTASNA